jgi:hypothetical protein
VYFGAKIWSYFALPFIATFLITKRMGLLFHYMRQNLQGLSAIRTDTMNPNAVRFFRALFTAALILALIGNCNTAYTTTVSLAKFVFTIETRETQSAMFRAFDLISLALFAEHILPQMEPALRMSGRCLSVRAQG